MTRSKIKDSEISMTSGSILKNIFLFSIPLVFTNLLQVLFNTVDVAVIGQFAGSLSLGAVGSTPNLIFMFTGLLIGLSAGANVIVAYHLGAKDQKSVDSAVHTSFLLSLFSGILIMILGIVFGRLILSAMHTKDILLDKAVLYFRIYMVGLPALSLYNFGNAIFSAVGDTKRPLLFLAIAGAVNVVLDLFFIVNLKMDVMGAALATVIAQYISAFLIIFYLVKGIHGIKLQLKHIRVDKNKLFTLIKIGVPAGFQNVIFGFANIFVQVGVNSFDPIMVSGTAASANVDPLIYNVMSAFYVAGATFIGQNFGANNKKRVLKSYYISMAMAFFIALFMGLILFFFGSQVLRIFTNDSSVIECGLHRVKIMAFSYCVSALMDGTIAACRGLGKTLVPSVIVFLGSCVFRIVWIYTIFAFYNTIESLFSLYIFSWAITAVVEMFYFYVQLKKQMK